MVAFAAPLRYASRVRFAAWCVAGFFLACGKAHTSGNGQPEELGGASSSGTDSVAGVGARGGSETNGGAGSGASGGAVASAGMPFGEGGRESASGGFSMTAGGAGASGMVGGAGAAAGAGGSASPMAGNAGRGESAGDGSVGAAGSPAACAEYVACGCGCCDDAPPTACYYPSRDNLELIIQNDEASAADPACADAACSAGAHYVCCLPPPEEAGVTYSVIFNRLEEYDRMTIVRSDAMLDCTTFGFSTIHEPPVFPVDTPEGFAAEGGMSDFPCSQLYNLTSRTLAMGGEGTVTFTAPDHCAIDFDFTLYFRKGTELPTATRFVAKGVPVPNVDGCN